MQLVRLMRRLFLSMNSLASGTDGPRAPGHLLRLGVVGPCPSRLVTILFVSLVVCDSGLLGRNTAATKARTGYCSLSLAGACFEPPRHVQIDTQGRDCFLQHPFPHTHQLLRGQVWRHVHACARYVLHVTACHRNVCVYPCKKAQ